MDVLELQRNPPHCTALWPAREPATKWFLYIFVVGWRLDRSHARPQTLSTWLKRLTGCRGAHGLIRGGGAPIAVSVLPEQHERPENI